jgi:hypothetical protein
LEKNQGILPQFSHRSRGFTMNERSLLPGERIHDPDREGLMVPSERSQANGVA